MQMASGLSASRCCMSHHSCDLPISSLLFCPRPPPSPFPLSESSASLTCTLPTFRAYFFLYSLRRSQVPKPIANSLKTFETACPEAVNVSDQLGLRLFEDHHLKNMQMLYMFFASPSGAMPSPVIVDPTPTLTLLRDLTVAVDARCLRDGSIGVQEIEAEIWRQRGLSRLLFVLASAHVGSFTPDDANQSSSYDFEAREIGGGRGRRRRGVKALTTSWEVLTAASQVYLFNVLNRLTPADALEKKLLRRMLLILQRYVSSISTSSNASMDKKVQDFCFWALFVATFALVATADISPNHTDGNAGNTALDELLVLRHSFEKKIRAWSVAIGLKDWAQAREALSRTAWPAAFPGDLLAAAVWHSAVRAGRPQLLDQ